MWITVMLMAGLTGCLKDNTSKLEDDSSNSEQSQEEETQETTDIIEIGQLKICNSFVQEETYSASSINQTGIVTALDDGELDCTRTITIEDDGEVGHFGFTVTNSTGQDITPELDIAEGSMVNVSWHYLLGFDLDSGFVVSDDSGLIVVADFGAGYINFGSGDNAGELSGVIGIEVQKHTDVIALEEGLCEPRLGHELVFESDQDSLSLAPISFGTLQSGDIELTALAIKATSWGEGENCSTTDLSPNHAWLLIR